MTAIKILLIEPDPADASLAENLLRQALDNCEVTVCSEAIEFARYLANCDFDVAIAEQALGWASGIETLTALKQQSPKIQCILFGRNLPVDAAGRASEAGLVGYLQKDSNGFLQLPERVRAALTPTRADNAGEALWSSVLEQLEMPALTVLEDGRILQANPAAERVLGSVGTDELAGLHLQELLATARATGRADKAFSDQLRALASGKLERLDSSVAPMHDEMAIGKRRLSAWIIPGSEQIAVLYHTLDRPVSSDVTILAQQNYQQLLYAVSHDLQEPLQLVSRHAHLLKDAYLDNLDSNGQRFVANLVSSADRMQSMLDDLLEYSRMGRMAATVEEVDLNLVVDQLIEMYQPRLQAIGGIVRKAGLPGIVADRGQINRLLQNLLGNAIKFHGTQPLVITVSARVNDDVWELVVRDNGIGMEADKVGQIFGMFKRLHTEQDYPGNGMGLSLCQRIVEAHGGRIWAKSEPGKGTAIHFTLNIKGPVAEQTSRERIAS